MMNSAALKRRVDRLAGRLAARLGTGRDKFDDMTEADIDEQLRIVGERLAIVERYHAERETEY